MSLLQILLKRLLYQSPESTTGDVVFESGGEDRKELVLPQPAAASPGKRSARKIRRPVSLSRRFAMEIAGDQSIDHLLKEEMDLFYDLKENRRLLEKIFRLPENKDAVMRDLSIGTDPLVKGLLLFIDGATNSLVQNLAILQPLMLFSGFRDIAEENGRHDKKIPKDPPEDFLERIKDVLLPTNQVAVVTTFYRVVQDVLNGNSVLLVDGFKKALSLETKNWPSRGVNNPQVEAVIRGPQEAFTEQIRINLALLRKNLHRPSLVTEFVQIGDFAPPMQCAVVYMEDIANPDLVREVKRRLMSVRADYLQESGLLEQMIEDAPHYPAPQVLTTERPDRVAASLVEGKVAVIVDGNPFVMLVPTTFFTLMHSPEDAYVRWPFGSFARIIRYAGLFLALLLPAHYVAIVAYHQEFIPTDLLLVMTGAREKVPFPSIVEVLLMELSFELIREAGIRIPGTVGTTLGIVGALILGQAAVAANIVSPILIIVVAVTAIGSFAIPNYSFSLSIRVLRFAYILLASAIGLLGILVGFFIHIGLLVNLKSFGVPFMAPTAPTTRRGSDFFLRGPVWRQEQRPDYLDTIRPERQPRVSRRWLYPNQKKGDVS